MSEHTESTPAADPLRFIDAAAPMPCFMCGLQTDQIEINFEAPLHRECEALADAMYWAAVSGEPQP